MCASGCFVTYQVESRSTPSFVIFSYFNEYRKIVKDEKKLHGAVDQSSSEQQFRKSNAITFVVCEIWIVLVGLTVGQQSDEIFLKFSTDRIVRIDKDSYSVIIVLAMHFSWLFQVKYIVRRVMEAHKSGTPCFSCRLSTTVRQGIFEEIQAIFEIFKIHYRLK